MITGDLDRALATRPGSAGTWRPAPPAGGFPPGTYATSVAFLLGGESARTASALAERLGRLPFIEAAEVTGGGYIAVTPTPEALAALAVRITRAGPACARSQALRGLALTMPASPRLARARTWEQARERLAAHLTGALAEAAGASVARVDDAERLAAADLAAQGGLSPVADAFAYAGADAITFALARTRAGRAARIDPVATAGRRLDNPAYAVRYAHAHAASVLRQAAYLGLDLGGADGFEPGLLAHPSERALLYRLSWLPERVAGAARRGQPDAFARYLEGLSRVYLDCQRDCPAAWPGMAPPADGGGRPAGPTAGLEPLPARVLITARLWLAAAARTALAAGLGLLGVGAPDRL